MSKAIDSMMKRLTQRYKKPEIAVPKTLIDKPNSTTFPVFEEPKQDEYDPAMDMSMFGGLLGEGGVSDFAETNTADSGVLGSEPQLF